MLVGSKAPGGPCAVDQGALAFVDSPGLFVWLATRLAVYASGDGSVYRLVSFFRQDADPIVKVG